MILNQVKTEQVVLSSIMDSPHTKFGPNICTMLANSERLASPEACELAAAISLILWENKVPSRPMVKAKVGREYSKWIAHSMFMDSMPIDYAEHEAFDLLPLYRNKRTIELVGRHYQQMIDHPEKAHELAVKLREELSSL